VERGAGETRGGIRELMMKRVNQIQSEQDRLIAKFEGGDLQQQPLWLPGGISMFEITKR